MFRSRSKFRNEAPMSRRGVRVGLVLTVVLAMVAVLASTVGVISSQSGTGSLTVVGNTTHSVVEGESLTITLTSSSPQGYELELAADSTTADSFDFESDVSGLVLSPNVGEQVLITNLPQTVDIDSGTTMITLWFRGANDLIADTGEQLVLSATPGSGTAVNTTITLNDPPKLEATFSGPSPITEGGSADIGITLNSPLTLSQLFSRRSGQSGYTREKFVGSNFEDISSIKGADFPLDDNNEQYNRNLGFDFWFYGKRHSYIAVHTNGFVGFTNDAKADVNEFVDPLPGVLNGAKTPSPDMNRALPIVAPLLSPIAYIGQTDAAFYGARLGAGTADDRYIVQYTNAASLVPGASPDRVASTFQVALYANGTIEFRYEDIPTSVQEVSKIGISTGTDDTSPESAMFDEFSYRKASLSATSNVRLVYTPKGSLINAVIKDSNGDTVETVDFLENVIVGMQNGSFSVSHPENPDWDGNQVYTVELASAVPLVTAPSPAPAAVTYTVNDNDDPVVTLQRVSGSGPIEIAEGTSVAVRARLTNAPGGAPEDLIVRLSTASVTTLELSEYTFPGEVTIPQNGQYVDFTVMITDDDRTELEEMLTIEVGDLVHSGGTVNKLPTPEKIDLTIPVNDTIAVTGITASDTNEGDMVTVMVSLNRVLPANTAANAVRLVLDGTDRTNDVTGSQWDITSDLKAGTSAEVMIRLVDDRILEGPERVTLRLMVDSALDDFFPAGARGGSSSFDIIDNESGEVGITPVSNTSPEDGDMVEFEVSLPDGVEAASAVVVSFEIITPPGVSVDIIDPLGLVTTVSASGSGTGFAQGLALPVRGFAQVVRTSYSIMIPAGQTSVKFTIQLTHDGNTEVREQLMVRLLSASTGSANPSVVVGSKAGLANITLSNLNEADFGGILPATGGLVLPVWLLVVLLLTGIALLVPTLRRLI